MKNVALGAALTGALVLATTTGFANQSSRMDAIWRSMVGQIERQADEWFEKGEFPKSTQTLRLQFEFEPHDYEVATNLGWMLENVELWDEALAVYIRFRKMNPQDPNAAYPEANFYFRRKAYAKVPQLLEPTLPRNPHANSFRTLAHSYEKMQMYADSKRTWEALLKRDPGDEAAKNNLRRVQSKIQKSRR